MLIDFNFTNFMSFKETAEFDMRPVTKDKKNELYGTNVFEVKASSGKKIPLLRSSVIYGANASGKTNFIMALRAMDRLILEEEGATENSIRPFKLNPESVKQPCRFEITILAEDNVVYEYGFSATTEAIHEEWLNAYPKGRIKKLFKRTLTKIKKTSKQGKEKKSYEYKYKNKLAGHKKTWEDATTPQRLFLSTAIQLNNNELRPVYDWFGQKLRFIGTSGFSPSFSARYFQDGNAAKIIRFLKETDLAIEDMKIEDTKIKENEMPPEVLNIIKKAKKDGKEISALAIEISTFHKAQDGENVKFDIGEESQGTQKMFSFAGPVLNSLLKGHILFIDELDNSLHPLLVKHIIELFQNKKTNPKNAQLIFTTHDASLFNEDIFLHDQVWFCEKNHKTQESELYSLIDFKPRKDIKNLERAYLHGRFGATPVVADPSIELLIKN